jgi:hypothetical protein
MKLIDERDGLEGVQRVAGQVHDAKLGEALTARIVQNGSLRNQSMRGAVLKERREMLPSA